MYGEMQVRPCGGSWAYCDGRCVDCTNVTVASTTSSPQTKVGTACTEAYEMISERIEKPEKETGDGGEVTPTDMLNLDLQNRFRNVGPYEVESSNPNWTREGNKPVVTIYGYSDDTVEIENSNYNEGSIDCFDKDVRLWFSDGTIIRIGYCKPKLGVWYIVREHVGTAEQTLLVCEDEDADPYSDVFCINAEIERHEVLGGNFGEINITEQ